MRSRPAGSTTTVTAALLRAELGRSRQAERLDGALLGHRAGRRWPNGKPVFNSTRPGGTHVRLPVHRLQPQHQRRPRPRLRRRRPTARCRAWRTSAVPAGTRWYRGQDALVVARAVAAGQDATCVRPWYSANACNAQRRRCCELAPLRRPISIDSPARRTRCTAASSRSIRPGRSPAACGPGTVRTVPMTNEPLLCNLWPYWFRSGAGAGEGCIGDQYLFPPSVDTDHARPHDAGRWECTVRQRRLGAADAGLVPRLVVHDGGPLPVRVQRPPSSCSSTATTICSSSSTASWCSIWAASTSGCPAACTIEADRRRRRSSRAARSIR